MADKKTEPEDLDITEDKDGSAVVVMSGDTDDQQAPAKDAGGAQDDEADHPDDSEAVRAARRARRRSKKDLIRKTNEEKDVRLTSLQRDNERMRQQLEGLDRRVQTTELVGFNKREEDMQVRHEYAKMKMTEAIASGDGDAIVAAQDLMLDSREALKEMQRVRTQIPKPQQNTADPRTTRNAETWMERNAWYKPNAADTDSKIAKQIDEELTKDGWDSNSPEYFDELDNRLQKYLPHRYNGATDDDEVKKPRNTVGSSGREYSAGSGGGNRTTFILSPERVKAMKDMGSWDNPERKAKMIKNYAAFDKANRSNV